MRLGVHILISRTRPRNSLADNLFRRSIASFENVAELSSSCAIGSMKILIMETPSSAAFLRRPSRAIPEIKYERAPMETNIVIAAAITNWEKTPGLRVGPSRLVRPFSDPSALEGTLRLTAGEMLNSICAPSDGPAGRAIFFIEQGDPCRCILATDWYDLQWRSWRIAPPPQSSSD